MMNEILPLGLNIFAKGAAEYLDYYPGSETAEINRIVLNICLANRTEPIPVIVDTGAPWCILNPLEFEEIADHADLIQTAGKPLNIRGTAYTGCLYRLFIWLPAVLGESLEVDATVFVPDEEWFYPNFIGLDGFLNRIRFAVDPKTNLFFFGTLDG